MIHKKEFIKIIDTLEAQYKHDLAFNLSITDILQAESMPMYDNSLLTGAILEMLGEYYDIREIHRFCYELNFGKAYGSDLKSAKELWNHVNLL